MIPPTSIDGTDITGATIDGTDVQEITMDGQTVFSAAKTLPVAYSNLVAWYPFDSAEYGGGNADDVTALFNPAQSGDSTAYNANVNGATHQSSGGVIDINAGPNSGAYDFDGSNDNLNTGSDINNICSSPFTAMAWVNMDSWAPGDLMSILTAFSPGFVMFADDNSGNQTFSFFYDTGPRDWVIGSQNRNTNQWYHVAIRKVGTGTSNMSIFVNGQDDTSSIRNSDGAGFTNNADFVIGFEPVPGRFVDGTIEDVRLYNTGLSNQQIQDIYNNTEP